MPPSAGPKRIDLHCHSHASNKSGEALLNVIRCPESYSKPDQVYAQARLRGMDFVTLTDHDSIAGAQEIADKPDVLIGEELTCWFPEDSCKMHVLVFGIGPTEHAELQSRARDIYKVAEFIESNQIAHSVAHPIYRQNDKLERWHVERLILMFKGFECLNGAHSSLHREAFEPLLLRLSRSEITRLSETHGLAPRWPEPWIKARTAGSDDHGLLNVGRTWTEFPPDTTTTEQLLKHLREGICRPGGESGSTAKLAHTFYSVAVRYYTNHMMSPGQEPNVTTTLIQMLTGQRVKPSRMQLLRMGVKHKLKKLARGIASLGRPQETSAGSALIKKLFLDSARRNLQNQPDLYAALENGLPPLGEHERMIEAVWQMNRDITQGFADAISERMDRAAVMGVFDAIGAILAHQFTLLPYYFAVFHQNKERHLLRQITGLHQTKNAGTLKVGLFTDTFDETNGVGRFLRDVTAQAARSGRQLIVHTCTKTATDTPGRKNFAPLLTRPLPFYADLNISLPPLLEILEWSDRQQFDMIHVSTPGPMGLCGWAVSKMLRVPLMATYHTDFPAYAESLARDHRITNATTAYIRWFYRQTDAVFARSSSYHFNLRDLGLPDEKLRTIRPGIDLEKFQSARVEIERDKNRPKRLLYCGRVSIEKNLPLLVQVFRMLSRKRRDVTLTVAGDGPYRKEMMQLLEGFPVELPGFQTDDARLVELYANSDLLVFPSRTDTLGQAVMEAQACGLPAIVTNEGGPKETVEHGVTGLVLTNNDPAAWCAAIEQLLDDEPRRAKMSRAAVARMSRFSLQNTFETFWEDHLAVVLAGMEQESPVPKDRRSYNPDDGTLKITLS